MIYQSYTFTIQALDTLYMPHYKGSTFRGGFGNVFRKVVCVLKKEGCEDCMLKSSCIYAYIFETAPIGDCRIMNMNKYEKIPHPFIIEPPLETKKVYENDETIAFNLVLIGRANDYIPYFIYAFDELGKIGIGKGRKPYKLLTVYSENEMIYNSQDKLIKNVPPKRLVIDKLWRWESKEADTEATDGMELTIQFITPVRIKFHREFAKDMPFHVLIINLLRRMLLLNYFHCEGVIPEYDPKKIIHEAQEVKTIHSTIKWWDWERYSYRQKTKMMMGGLMGEITYKGNIEPFMELIKAGEVVHVGKGTGFGLGKYKILS